MKILITGINGQVGSDLVKQARDKKHEVVGVSRKHWDMSKHPEKGEQVVLKTMPDLVINSAAYTDVNRAEDDEQTAFDVNCQAPRAMAIACRKLDIPLFHISTDYVFNGHKRNPYTESDEPCPINAYGRSKLAGEVAIKQETQKFIILRTSWVFSKNGNNFVNTIIDAANKLDELKIVDDQYGGPTYAGCIADILLKLANDHRELWGIYNFCQKPYISWYHFAESILIACYENNRISNIPKLTPIDSRGMNLIAKRPKNSKLSTEKILKTFKFNCREWESSIIEILDDKTRL